VLLVMMLMVLIIRAGRRLKRLPEGRAAGATTTTSTTAAAAVAICDGQTPEAVAARPQGAEATHACSQAHAATAASHGSSMKGAPANACAARGSSEPGICGRGRDRRCTAAATELAGASTPARVAAEVPPADGAPRAP
jgi:hypothetical protein